MNGGTTHASAREMSDRLKSLESESNTRSERADLELLQSVIDIQTQELLKNRKRREEFTDKLGYNGSQDFANPIKQSSAQYALMCTPTNGIYVGPSKAWGQIVVLETPTSSVGSPHAAHIAEDDTEYESPRPLQDNDNEGSDSDTSGKFNEEPERPH
jgi:hypothetical protein